MIPGIEPLGYIIERLRTTGLTNATNANTPPSYIIHDNLRNAPEDHQKPIPELVIEDSSNDDSDGEHKEMDNTIPASAASTAASAASTTATATATTAAVASAASTTATAITAAVASAASAATATATTIVSYNCPLIIMIGNRGDQHYYSIGTWLAAGQVVLIIIIIIIIIIVNAFFTSSQFISTEAERVNKNGSHR